MTLPARPAGSGPPPGGAGGAGGGTGTGTTGTGTTGTGTTGTGTTGTGTTPRRGSFFGGGPGGARTSARRCGPRSRRAARTSALAAAVGGFRGRISHTAITSFVTCVKQHGYNLPAPNFSGKGPIFPRNIETNAKFQAASKACQHLLIPPRPPSGSGGTSTTSGA